MLVIFTSHWLWKFWMMVELSSFNICIFLISWEITSNHLKYVILFSFISEILKFVLLIFNLNFFFYFSCWICLELSRVQRMERAEADRYWSGTYIVISTVYVLNFDRLEYCKSFPVCIFHLFQISTWPKCCNMSSMIVIGRNRIYRPPNV